MTLEIEINGRVRLVAIEPIGSADSSGGRFRVSIDGHACEVTASPTDLGLSLVWPESGRSVDAGITSRPGGECLVQLPHVAVSAIVEGRRAQRRGAADAGGTGEQRILAPMPGRVMRVLVKPGDEVVARQGLVVVEAMKMENELAAPRAGRVKDVLVTDGTSVEAGRLLLRLE